MKWEMILMILKTERLILREFTMNDLGELYAILLDPQSMKYYPAPFSYEKYRQWIQWNLDNYKKYGFGLWAVTRKEGEKFIGDCGITMQTIDGSLKPEIGFHISKIHTRKGYASEAAGACRDYSKLTGIKGLLFDRQREGTAPHKEAAPFFLKNI
jgi:RimJ/RimL family protein N-acetyltransferase